MKDHYATLQVTRDADVEVIDKAYRALSLKYHPDTASAEHRERATRRMQRINAAHRVLRDPVARARYDATLPSADDPHAGAWERFLEVGLAGMFLDWWRKQS